MRRARYERIGAAVEHAHQPVQRGVGIRSRAPTCAAPRSGRRTPRRPCRTGAGSARRRSRTNAPSIALHAARSRAAVWMISSRLSRRRASPSAKPIDALARLRVEARAPAARCATRAVEQRAELLRGRGVCSTYTAARESSAEFTSNDGFSVVAPTKVKRPCSTYGRNASCCALLKRCTSSTKRMVARPLRGEDVLRAAARPRGCPSRRRTPPRAR